MMYRALVIDIDGTLLDERNDLTLATHKAISRAVQSRMMVMLATGRSVSGALPVHQQLGMKTPMVCLNGLLIYDPPSQAWIRSLLLPDDHLEELLALANDLSDFFLVTNRDGYLAIAGPNPHQKTITDLLENVTYIPAANALPHREVVKIQLFCTISQRDELSHRLSQSLYRDTICLRDFPLQTLPGLESFPLCYVDLEPISLGKAEALTFLLERHGIPAEQVIAVGDQINDLPMIEAAGLGVAMGQGAPELLKVADKVIGPNTANGLAHFVEQLLAHTVH